MGARPLLLSLLFLTTVVSTSAAERLDRLRETAVLANYAGDWYTVPTSINNRGEIAGWAVSEQGAWVAFFRSRGGRYQRVVADGYTHDISNRGEIVGVHYPCTTTDCEPEGFVWSRRGGLQNLGSFVPFAVNDKGDMAGVCVADWQACVMRGGVVVPIADPGSEARGINARGDVVGTYGDNRAFYLTRGWQFRDIGRAAAEDINSDGVIAGHRWVDMAERGERAVLTAWTKRKPRSPAREVSIGIAINKQGWIVANAWNEHEEPYSFIWSSVTNARVVLEGLADEWVSLEDINDRGDVVGTAGTRAVIWHVRKTDLARKRR